jgi:hypothetical protein
MNGPGARLRPRSSSCKPGGRSPVGLCDSLLVGAGNADDGDQSKGPLSTHEFFSASNAISVAFPLRRFAGTLQPGPLRDRGMIC